VGPDRLEGGLGQDVWAVVEGGETGVVLVEGEGGVGGFEDADGGGGHLRADAVAGDQDRGVWGCRHGRSIEAACAAVSYRSVR